MPPGGAPVTRSTTRGATNEGHGAPSRNAPARLPPAPQPALCSAATRRPRAAAPRAPQRPPPRARPGGPPIRAALTERQQQRLQGASGQRGARPAEHGWGGAGRSVLRSVRAGRGTGRAERAHRSHLLAPVKLFSPFTAPSSPPVLSSPGVPPFPLSEQLYPSLSPCFLRANRPCGAPRSARGYKAAPAPPNSGRTSSGCAGQRSGAAARGSRPGGAGAPGQRRYLPGGGRRQGGMAGCRPVLGAPPPSGSGWLCWEV